MIMLSNESIESKNIFEFKLLFNYASLNYYCHSSESCSEWFCLSTYKTKFQNHSKPENMKLKWSKIWIFDQPWFWHFDILYHHWTLVSTHSPMNTHANVQTTTDDVTMNIHVIIVAEQTAAFSRKGGKQLNIH